jgi:glyoxylase-like metal-dependent hydrolase (beta-lactamase superfamily II)
MTGLVVAGRALIGGDSLFADGLARPDLQKPDPDGARAMARTLHATITERILPLGDEVVLLPGHAHPGVHAHAIAPTLGEVRRAVPELAIEDPDRFAEEIVAAMPSRPANYEAVIAVNAGTQAFDAELEAGGNSCATR